MALTAVIEFGDNSIKRYSKRYLVSDCHFVFDRQYNSYSPEETARCERIELVVVAPGREDLGVFNWFARQEVKEGHIIITLTGDTLSTDSENQEILFEDAKCFSLSEMYDINSSSRRLLKLAITAGKIEIDGISFNCI